MVESESSEKYSKELFPDHKNTFILIKWLETLNNLNNKNYYFLYEKLVEII